MPPRVFISYSSKDSETAKYIYSELEKRGVDVFIDYRSLDDGDDFHERLAGEIEERDKVLFLVSTHSVNSKWVKVELQYAFNKDKPIIPIALDETEIPRALFFVGSLHRRAFTKTKDTIDRLCRALGVEEEFPPRTLVIRFQRSESEVRRWKRLRGYLVEFPGNDNVQVILTIDGTPDEPVEFPDLRVNLCVELTAKIGKISGVSYEII